MSKRLILKKLQFRETNEGGCPSDILSRKGTIISYLIAFERLFRTKQTKKEPACSVEEQAGIRYIEFSGYR